LDPLVYIIRGLPHPLDKSIVEALADYLKGRSNLDPLMEKLKHASDVMIPMPEYDITDFDDEELQNSVQLLQAGDEHVWGQLLHALDDKHSPHWKELKELSPYKDDYLMFLDASFGAAAMEADLDDALAAEFQRRADMHDCPGNQYLVRVPPEALELMSFVSAIDDLPATA
jgi:hypothetical protein